MTDHVPDTQRIRRRRAVRVVPEPVRAGRFAAIDFETADYGRDSACALAVVTGSEQGIERRFVTLIRPPRPHFIFTYIHGITWAHVHDKPVFRELLPRILRELDGVDFIAAHNASFDRGVLYACCEAAGAISPAHRFLCTVKAARRVWGMRPAGLADVCRNLAIPLNHHEAESDALACARIVIEAMKRGIPHEAFLDQRRGGR